MKNAQDDGVMDLSSHWTAAQNKQYPSILFNESAKGGAGAPSCDALPGN
jgi:hypothetical protein